MKVAAGEDWDAFVAECVERNLAGIETLSGIPGSAGATPIQNVGAYGQDVSQAIVSVKVLDTETLEEVEFSNEQCGFGYRSSRFKTEDAGRYVVVAVTFQLVKDGKPTLKYPQLIEKVGSRGQELAAVRRAVLELRRSKSMVIDESDPHSRSCGSFFMNVVFSKDDFEKFMQRIGRLKLKNEMPSFSSGDEVKVPAAWLVEQAGFEKGQRHGGVGISQNHMLALVNYEGTTEELLTLAEQIQRKVKDVFNVELKREPMVVSSVSRTTR